MRPAAPRKTELVVVGAGPGGYAAAFYAADNTIESIIVRHYEKNPLVVTWCYGLFTILFFSVLFFFVDVHTPWMGYLIAFGMWISKNFSGERSLQHSSAIDLGESKEEEGDVTHSSLECSKVFDLRVEGFC